MLMRTRYDGPIEPGMVFRHRSFDIRCEVVKVDGVYVSVRPICSSSGLVEEVMAHPIGLCRAGWSPVT